MKTRWAIALCALLAGSGSALADPCEAPLPPVGKPFSGVVTWVGDGDGLCIGPDKPRRIEVRVADFYAIELNDPGGRDARNVLRKLVLNQHVECVGSHYNRDRIVAICTLNGRRIGDLMREKGVPEGGNGYPGR